MQAMSDRSIDVDDLVEENKYLRQELFALCDRIREAEAWTRSHRREECGPVTDTDQTGETNDTDQLAVLESEIVQIRLTNFELLQKLKQLETARIQAQEESKRMERELQRLLPSALEVTRLQKALDASQAQHRRLQLAHRAAAVVWSRSAEQHRRSQSQQCASQATHDELALQYQEQQLQLSRTFDALRCHQQQLTTAVASIARLEEELHGSNTRHEQLIAELHHAQSRCASQAKELERLKARVFDIQVITPTADVSPSPHPPCYSPRPASPTLPLATHHNCGVFCLPL